MDQIRWVRPAFVSDRRRRRSLKPSSPSSSLPRSLLTFRIQLVFSPPLCRFQFKHSMRGYSSDFLFPLRCFLSFFLDGAIVIRDQPPPRKVRNSARLTCDASMSPESVVFFFGVISKMAITAERFNQIWLRDKYKTKLFKTSFYIYILANFT
jgi:hypothetical protein